MGSIEWHENHLMMYTISMQALINQIIDKRLNEHEQSSEASIKEFIKQKYDELYILNIAFEGQIEFIQKNFVNEI